MKKTIHFIGAAAICAVATQLASAAPLLEETFDYTTGSVDSQNGGTGWGSGWSVTVPADHAGSAANVTAGSIAFSDYVVAGNKLTVDITPTSFDTTDVAREVAIGATSGDLWASFLYRRVDTGSNGSRGVELRVEPVGDPLQMGMSPKGSSTRGAEIRYDGADGGTDASTDLQNNEPYLFIARFADLGQATGDGATLWGLSVSDYDAIKSGGITVAELNANASIAATDAQSGSDVLNVGDVLNLATFTSQPITYEIDEIRYSDTLNDALTIPEPGSFATVLVGALALGLRRRR